MATFSTNSKNNLLTCSIRLQTILNTAITYYDFSVICGHRSKAKQDDVYSRGLSQVKWPHSKHNSVPSTAVDIYPWHRRYKSLTTDGSVVVRIMDMSGCSKSEALAFIREEYCMMAQTLRIAAQLHGTTLRWGGDWDSDFDRLDQTFDDLAHFELVD